MQPYQDKAWSCLTKEEQDSLFLNISQGLSTRKVGDILNMSHYKYLELKARAEKFFKMFSDYFYKHPDLVRPGAPITEGFRDYLYGLIYKRLPKEEAATYAGESLWHIQSYNFDKTKRNMERLKESKNEWDQDLYKLIMEFDRWNSFRVLPRALQAPTPYRRKSNRKYKAYMKYLHRIPYFKIQYLIDTFWKKSGPVNFIALVSEKFKFGYQVVPISKEENVTKLMSNSKIYVFNTRVNAEDFGLQVSNFFYIGNVQAGIKFWNHFNDIVKEAINYDAINNRDFVTGDLDNAFKLCRIPQHKLMNDGKRAKKKAIEAASSTIEK